MAPLELEFELETNEVQKEERTTTFTALGMTGSGKTCYIIGMHYVMVSGEKGWTLHPGDNRTADKLNRWVRKIDNENSGMDRFPAGTDQGSSENFCFGLHYVNKQIMNFNWIDYAGALFEETSSLGFREVENSISNSTALYIFIDGTELCDENRNRRFKNIKQHCARYIQPCITDFINNYNDFVPPVVFVVTKSDLCRNYTNTKEIVEILRDSFNSLFYDTRAEVYVTAVTLGDDISDNGYTGEVEPVNIQIPFFIGIHHELVRRYRENQIETEEEKILYRKMISNMTDALYEKREFFEIIRGDKNGGSIKPFDLEEWRIF